MRMLAFAVRPCLAALLLLASIVPVAEAQLCFGPDNLVGPCCTQVPVNLPSPIPTPPPLPALGICWTACSPTTTPAQLTFTTIGQNQCGQFGGGLIVDDGAGTLLMRGTLTLDYTRTWAETNFAGDVLQCWRFMAKIDFFPSTPGAPCPVPQGGEPSMFYYGYFDLVLNCNTGANEWAIVLFHSCDKFIHHPLASGIPGPFHPQDAYALVAPVTAANPFVPVVLPPIAGPVTGGAMRRAGVPGTVLCFTEENIPAGAAQLGIIGQACACPLSTTLPLQYAAQPFTGQTACGSSGVTIQTPTPFPWLHLITASIGNWTGGGPGTPYPGPEAAWVNEGFFFNNDGCTGIPFIEVMYGAMTGGGFPVIPDNLRPWQTSRMLDLASNYSRSTGITPPFVGRVNQTSRLIYVNF
ncbi:MAG: hypothetical protein RL885_19260 [Planctomycetota bacterium]